MRYLKQWIGGYSVTWGDFTENGLFLKCYLTHLWRGGCQQIFINQRKITPFVSVKFFNLCCSNLWILPWSLAHPVNMDGEETTSSGPCAHPLHFEWVGKSEAKNSSPPLGDGAPVRGKVLQECAGSSFNHAGAPLRQTPFHLLVSSGWAKKKKKTSIEDGRET